MAKSPLARVLRRAVAGAEARPRLARSQISRRHLLVGAAAGLTLPRLAGPARAQAGPSVAVIGGGLAGLVAARRLTAGGARPVIYEARRRVGGRVETRRPAFAPTLALDLGGAFVNADHSEILGLCADTDQTLIDTRTFGDPQIPAEAYWIAGAWRDEAEIAGALAPLAARIASDAEALDADWEGQAPTLDARSVADYLVDAAGPAGTDPLAPALIRLVMRAEYGVEPEAASALELIWLAPQVEGAQVALLGSSDEAFKIAGGAAALPQALAAELGDVVRLDRPVAGLSAQPGRGVTVTFVDGQAAEHDAAVVTLPLPVLRTLDLDLDLPDRFQGMLAEGRLGRNEKHILAAEGRPWRQAGRFTSQMWTDAGACVVWDGSEGQTSDVAALTSYLGGVEAAAAPSPELLRGRLDGLLPGLAPALRPGVVASTWGSDPLTQGGYTSFAPGAYTRFADWLWWEEDGEASGPVFGPVAFAGEHLSDAFYGYMEGAAQTGRLAAEALLAA